MKYIIPLAAVMVLTGCTNAARQTPSVMPPITPPQAYVEPEQKYENPGSLYLASESDALFADSRARRVGDIVMVKVVENHKAKNKNDVTAERTSNTANTVDAFFGKSAAGVVPPTALGMKVPVGQLGYGTTSTSTLSSTGETNREGTVTATIAARVTRVLPGNLLQIEGARETRVNSETQYMVVTGLIRSMDVAPDNSIESNRIADAHIAYYGQGILTDKEKPGWFTRLVDNAWPY